MLGLSRHLEIELADARVPDAALGILVDMVEGHAIRRIEFLSWYNHPSGNR